MDRIPDFRVLLLITFAAIAYLIAFKTLFLQKNVGYEPKIVTSYGR